jgi:hypothetical protein
MKTYVNLEYKKNDTSSNMTGGSDQKEIMSKWDNLNKITNNVIKINQVPTAQPNELKLYTIPEGTILYHGSVEKESFNPFRIVLNKDTLVSYFTASKKLSADNIIGCARYPSKSGYIHKFRVKADIKNILIVSPYEKQPDWDNKFIENNFCFKKNIGNITSSLTEPLQLDGIGFFYSSNTQKTLMDSNSQNLIDGNGTTSEFALCNPNKWLQYISTQRCIGIRQLSNEYNFTHVNQ